MPREPPTDKVLYMKKKGMSDEDVRNNLSIEGYSPTEIHEAISQSSMKSGVEEDELPPIPGFSQSQYPGMQQSMLDDDMPIPAPTPSNVQQEQSQVTNIPQYIQPQSQMQPQSMQLDREIVNRLVESIIDERWQEVVSSIGDIGLWKSSLDDELSSIKQEIVRMDQRYNNIQKAVLGKVDEYNENIMNINTEMKALEKVFEKIMEPLTDNIKELNRITKEMKERNEYPREPKERNEYPKENVRRDVRPSRNPKEDSSSF
jgi:hypothetical protein